jgi:hypothetical protein
MGLKKFKEKKDEVEDVYLAPSLKRDVPYNKDYPSRAFNDKVLKGLHYKQLKYSKELHDELKKKLDELRKSNSTEDLKKIGLDSINSMFVYAVKKTFFNNEE